MCVSASPDVFSGIHPVRPGTCSELLSPHKTKQKPQFVCCFACLVFLLIVVKVPTISPGVAAYTPLFYAIIYSLRLPEFRCVCVCVCVIKKPVEKQGKS